MATDVIVLPVAAGQRKTTRLRPVDVLEKVALTTSLARLGFMVHGLGLRITCGSWLQVEHMTSAKILKEIT